MKNLIFKAILTTSILFLTSCAGTFLSENSAPLTVSAKSSLEAEISVGEKITGEGSCMYLFGFIPLKMQTHATQGLLSPSWAEIMWGQYNISKHQAAYNAVKNNNADVLVDPSFEITSTDFFLFRVESATVTGYKGTVEGFKNVDSKEVMTIRDARN